MNRQTWKLVHVEKRYCFFFVLILCKNFDPVKGYGIKTNMTVFVLKCKWGLISFDQFIFCIAGFTSVCSWQWRYGMYCKNPKNLDAQKIAVIILKIEKYGFTIE